MKYHQKRIVSGKGREPHQFTTALRGVVVDSKDQLFAVGDTAVKVFDSQGVCRIPRSIPSPSTTKAPVFIGLPPPFYEERARQDSNPQPRGP